MPARPDLLAVDRPTAVSPTALGWRRNLTGHDAHLVGPRGRSWWTGQAPDPVRVVGCPSALPPLQLSNATAEDLRARFENAWTLTELLFASLQGEEAFYRPPSHGLRLPLIFYYGHPAAFHVNKLRLAGLVDEPVDPEFERLLAAGVDEMSWDDVARSDGQWPRVDEVTAYRREVHGRVLRVIDRSRDASQIGWDDPLWALLMAIEHELIHVETSSVLVRELPLRLVRRPETWPDVHAGLAIAATPESRGRWIEVPSGEAVLGKPLDHPTFGWDNEYGALRRDVSAFRAASCLVSNAEFREFVAGGGYSDDRWWSESGSGWRNFRSATHPRFWVASGRDPLQPAGLRLPFEIIRMPWTAPAIVNCHEADAYAAWRSAQDGILCRLPSELEYARLVGHSPAVRETRNIALSWGSESPVAALPPDPRGFHDLTGNVWQWSSDVFAPLPGFQTHRYYDDYSRPSFDAAHRRLFGGSFATCGAASGAFVRNHFRPHFLQHAGIRLVHEPAATSSPRT